MTTGKDYGLPAEYADWVEVPKPLKSPFRPEGAHVEIQTMRYEPQRLGGGYIGYPARVTRYFVPPKPKPTLPDVGPGAVVGYVDHYGEPVRVMRTDTSWTDRHGDVYSDRALLADVDDDGFTVELEGL